MSRTFDRWLVGAGGLVALLVAATVLNFHNTRQLSRDAYWVAHTHEVLDTLEKVVGHVREAEAVQRIYLIVGGDTLPPAFKENIDLAKKNVDTVKGLTADNQQQQDRIPDIERKLKQLEAAWSRTATVRKEQGFDAAKSIVQSAATVKPMVELQGRLREMDHAEKRLLKARSEQREQTFGTAILTGLLTGAAAVAGVVAFMVLLRRHLAARITAAFQLAEQGERLRTTLASIGDAVIATDTECHITSMNAVAESLTCWATADAVGQPLDTVFRIVNEETRRAVESPATRALREGVIVGLANHTVLIGKDGTDRPIDDSAAPIRCKEGEVVGCVLVFRDVTERRRREREQKRLEHELREIAAELSEAHRRKDEFLATLAHELRNPLAPIRTGLQVLRLAKEGSAAEQVYDMLERQMAQLVRLVDDLLDISRISRNKLALRKACIPLASVIENAVETARPHIDAKGQTLSVMLPPQPVYLDADPTRLAQVFWNLLNNSAKYTDPGGRIELFAERQGSAVVVTVRDNGIGIPSGALGNLFTIFSQVDHSLERTQGGLGIGLALVKGLVEMHGGNIEAHSAGTGQGSEFIVRLPVAPDPRQIEKPPAVRNGAAATRRRVLVVDDNRDAAATLAMMLSVLGHDTRTVHDGLQAIEMAEAFVPDVLLLDIGLPKLNGYDACRRIREQPWGKGIFIVAVTGWGQEENRRRSQEAGFDHHLVKPVDPAALQQLLVPLATTLIS